MKIRWNIDAFEEIRRLPAVDEMLQNGVNDVLSQVGIGYDGIVEPGRSRSRGAVWTEDYEAILDNSRHQSLLRALTNVRV